MFLESHKNIGRSRVRGALHSDTINLLVYDVIKAKFYRFGDTEYMLTKCVLGKAEQSLVAVI